MAKNIPHTRQKCIDKVIETTEIVEVDGKWVKKSISKTIKEPQFKEEDLYADKMGRIIENKAPKLFRLKTLILKISLT